MNPTDRISCVRSAIFWELIPTLGALLSPGLTAQESGSRNPGDDRAIAATSGDVELYSALPVSELVYGVPGSCQRTSA